MYLSYEHLTPDQQTAFILLAMDDPDIEPFEVMYGDYVIQGESVVLISHPEQ